MNRIPSAASPVAGRSGKPGKLRSGIDRFRKESFYQSMAIMGGLFLLVFCYLPMFGIVMAFQNFEPVKGFAHSPFVGLQHFRELFNDSAFWLAARNTLVLSVLKFILGFICPLVFALLLSELKDNAFKKFVQTASYLPHFISWVIAAGLITVFFSGGADGVLNPILIRLGLIEESIAFLTYPGYFIMIALITDVWKFTGFAAIIYVAAIAGVDHEVHEAATVDGASRLQRMYKITIPMIKNTIIVLLILGIGNLFAGGLSGSNFNQAYLLGNTLNMSVSDVLDTYILRMGLQLGRFSFAAASGLLLSVISLLLIFISNWGIKKLNDGEAIF